MKEISVTTLNWGVYNRKSSDSEDKQVQSIETQERENMADAMRWGLNIIGGCNYKEKGSAFKLGREQFEVMLEDIEKAKINGILVIHPNRLARNPVDAGRIISLMDEGKLLAIKTPSKAFFPTGIDKMMLGLDFLISKKDSDDKSDFVKSGLKTKALKGLPSGVATLGFLNDQTNEKGNRKWRVDPDRFPLITLILRRFLEGTVSASRLHKYAVQELKLTTPKRKRIGGVAIVRSRIYKILADPVYAGFFFSGGVRYELDPSLLRIITEEEHNRILELLGSKYTPKTQVHTGIFTGYMRSPEGVFIGQDPKLQLICDCKRKFAYSHRDNCPACGKSVSEMDDPLYLAYTYYYNVGRKKAGVSTKHINENKVSDYFLDYVHKNLLFSKNLADWSRKYLKELRDKEVAERTVIATRQNEARREVESKKIRYREMLADGLITPAEYRSDMERLQKSVSFSDEGGDVTLWFEKANEIVDLTQELETIFRNKNNTEAKRKLLSRLGSNLTWDEKKLNIINRKSVQALVEGFKRAKLKNQQFEPGKTLADKDKSGVFAAVCPSLLRG